MPLSTAIQRLTDRGVQGATPEIVVAELATRNQLSAQRIYEISRGAHDPGGGTGRAGSGAGPGRMTLAEFCESRGISLPEAQARLAASGINAEPGHTLRDIALAHGYDRPRDIMDMVMGTTR